AVRDPVNRAAFEYSSEASHWSERTSPNTFRVRAGVHLGQRCRTQIAIAQMNNTVRRCDRLRALDHCGPSRPAKKNSLTCLAQYYRLHSGDKAARQHKSED